MNGYQEFLSAAYQGQGGQGQTQGQGKGQPSGPNPPAGAPTASEDLPVIVPALIAHGLIGGPEEKPVYHSVERGPTKVEDMHPVWAQRAAHAVREGRREASPRVLRALDVEAAA
jgi:hypothetical protein